jgi:hypothetical protein
LDGYVVDLVEHGGAVVAGGAWNVGGTLNARVARWNGATWDALGGGLGLNNGAHRVTSLAVYQDQLYAGGWFQSGNGANAIQGIARWDGSAWRPVGGGLTGEAHALQVHNGVLVVGGIFSHAGGQPANSIATWNGAAWQPLGSGTTGGVYALCVYSNELIAGGRIDVMGGLIVNNVARWDGAAWHTMAGGVTGPWPWTSVYDLAATGNGLIVAGAFVQAGGVPAVGAARWNGSAWSAIGEGVSDSAGHIGLFQGEICLSGGFLRAGPHLSVRFARWSETGVPWIARQPEPAQVAAGGNASLSLAVATGYGELSYRWRRGGIELSDGGTASGSIVVGATSPNLSIMNVGGQDAGTYDCVVTRPCGGVTSQPALLSVLGGCYANCDGSVTAPVLNVADFTCFLQRFAAGDSYANCDGSVTPPVLNVADFTCFLQRFAAGCP